jgi:3-oxoacid CoA-transferase
MFSRFRPFQLLRLVPAVQNQLKYTNTRAFSVSSAWNAKIYTDPNEAIADLHNGATVLVGGFGLCGIPETVIDAIRQKGVKELTIISNTGGIFDYGVGRLLHTHQVDKTVASYVGENAEFEQEFLDGELEVEFVPQGTLVERVRAGGAGIAGFFTPTGAGTMIHLGGVPLKYEPRTRNVAYTSKPKESRVVNGRTYVYEEAITGDFALVKAWRADKNGNLMFRCAATTHCVIQIHPHSYYASCHSI